MRNKAEASNAMNVEKPPESHQDSWEDIFAEDSEDQKVSTKKLTCVPNLCNEEQIRESEELSSSEDDLQLTPLGKKQVPKNQKLCSPMFPC